MIPLWICTFEVFFAAGTCNYSIYYDPCVLLYCLTKQSATKISDILYVIQMTKNAYVGALVDGIITDIHTYGLHIKIKNTDLR